MSASWHTASRILAIRLDAMGDVVMTGAALEALAESGRTVSLLTSPAGERIARLMPWVRRIHTAEVPWMKVPPSPSFRSSLDGLVDELRRERYDAAVIFTVYSQNPLPAAMLAFLADIPMRIAHCRENPYHLLTEWLPEREPTALVRHEVRRQLDLVEAITGPLADRPLRLVVPPQARDAARETTAHLKGEWFAIHPGASAASRRYPWEKYARAIQQIYHETGYTPVITGGRDEVPLVQALSERSGVPCHSLAGCFHLPVLAAVIAEAPLLICNNTGPAHIAAAVGTPIVSLYAQTNPQHTPWMVPCRVLHRKVPCGYCYQSRCQTEGHPCLTSIEPDEIVGAALSQLTNPQISPREQKNSEVAGITC